MNLYISDLHFGHKDIINFDHRPFRDVDEMDRCLIKLWNSRVQKNDDIYIVGDFACDNEKPEQWYLRQLRGNKHLIVGNHDNKLLKNNEAMSYFESADSLLHLTDQDRKIVLCHYSMAKLCENPDVSYFVYGHIHSKKDEMLDLVKTYKNTLNASACINNYTPGSINELIRNNMAFQRRRIFMTRSSTRLYWLSNDSWYTVRNGKFVLTSVAPPEAKRSFAEWNKPRKITLRRLLRTIRAKLF